MSASRQQNKVQEVIKDIDFLSKFTKMVRELNISYGMIRETSEEIGHFGSILVLGEDNMIIRLSISASIEESAESN